MTSVRFLPLLLTVGATALAAQQSPDARWLPWLGCWQVGETAEPGVPLVCVRPVSDSLGVRVTALIGGESIASRLLIADGQPHDVVFDDCSGSQVATFSTDGRRVYLQSTLACQEGEQRVTSGIMAMASPTMWLDAQSTSVDHEAVSQALHYYPAPADRWPDEFVLSPELADSVTEARVRAAAPMTMSDVEEAARHVDQDALGTFFVERHQRFDLTAAGLVALADAAVPAAVIDALVAVSYPGRFAVQREEAPPVLPAVAQPPRPAEAYRNTYDWRTWSYAPCSFGIYCDPYSYGAAYPYYYNLYNHGYGVFVYGYGPYDSRGYIGRQVIIDRTVRPRGVAVRGRGYTRGGAAGGTGSYARRRSGSAGGWTVSPGYSSSGSSGGTGRATSGGYSRGGGSSSSGSSSGKAKSRGGHE